MVEGLFSHLGGATSKKTKDVFHFFRFNKLSYDTKQSLCFMPGACARVSSKHTDTTDSGTSLKNALSVSLLGI